MISINMITITNPQYLWISLLWFIIAILLRWILQQKQDYRIPTQKIIRRKQWIWIWIQIIILISFLLLPLELHYKKNNEKEFIIIWDSSLSMHSEDTYPSRYHLMNEVIKKVEKEYVVKQCYSQRKLDICKNTIVIPNSWSSVSDLLAVALYSSSDSRILEQYNFLIISDWGINNGIDFDSLFISWENYDSIYRIDLMPNEEIIISWSIIAQQQLLEKFPPIWSNYIRSTNNDNISDIRKNIEQSIKKKEWTIPLNSFFIFIILSGLSFLCSVHLFCVIKNQPLWKRLK